MKKSSIVFRLKLWSQTALHHFKQILLLSRSIAEARRNRQRESAQYAAEAERLDRIRNPSEYLGK